MIKSKSTKELAQTAIKTLFVVTLILLAAFIFQRNVPSYKLNNIKPSISFGSSVPVSKSEVEKSKNSLAPININKGKSSGAKYINPIMRGSYMSSYLSPNAIKHIYGLYGSGGGTGTIAIIDAGYDTTAQADLAAYSTMYNLPQCGVGCFTQYKEQSQGTVADLNPNSAADQANLIETTLDIELVHAIAPNAKILLIEEPSLNYFLYGVNYANSISGVIAVSMSLGGPESSNNTSFNRYFSNSNIGYFAAAGDQGYQQFGQPCTQSSGYPASSPKVIAVGGTTVQLNYDGTIKNEKVWGYPNPNASNNANNPSDCAYVGTGGGLSQYESETAGQVSFGVPGVVNSKRATPDVALNSDNNTGYAIYSSAFTGGSGWQIVGGTSAATPIWAAIDSLDGGKITNPDVLYADAKNTPSLFRKITSGQNGPCGKYCSADPTVNGLGTSSYNYETGLGVPTTYKY